MELLLLLGALGLGGVAGLFDPLPSFWTEYSPPKYRTYTESRQYTKYINCTQNEIYVQNERRNFTPREEVVRNDGAMAFPSPQKFPSSITQHLSSNKIGKHQQCFSNGMGLHAFFYFLSISFEYTFLSFFFVHAQSGLHLR